MESLIKGERLVGKYCAASVQMWDRGDRWIRVKHGAIRSYETC